MKKIEIGDVMLEQDIEKVLYSEEEIIAKTKELGTQLTKDYEGKNPLLIGVYVCYDVPNEFIVGFGLDYAERYRNLPYVGVLKKEIYSN